MFPEMP